MKSQDQMGEEEEESGKQIRGRGKKI